MKIFNGTANEINIIENSFFDPKDRKYKGGTHTTTISLNHELSAEINAVYLNVVNHIPFYKKRIILYEPLPEGYDIYILSEKYILALKSDSWYTEKSIYMVSDPVYTDDGQTIIGHKGLVVI